MLDALSEFIRFQSADAHASVAGSPFKVFSCRSSIYALESAWNPVEKQTSHMSTKNRAFPSKFRHQLRSDHRLPSPLCGMLQIGAQEAFQLVVDDRRRDARFNDCCLRIVVRLPTACAVEP